MGYIFEACAYLSGWIILAVQAVMIASGLYLLAELIEEAITPMRKILSKSIIIMPIFYFLLLIDGTPILVVLVGTAAHLSLYPLLKNFPYVNPMSPKTWIPLGLLLVNHFVWFHHFIDLKKERIQDHYNKHGNYGGADTIYDEDIPFMSIVGFLFIFVWMIPLGFFISVVDIEEALPSAHNGFMPSSSSTSASTGGSSNSFYNYQETQGGGDGMLGGHNDYNMGDASNMTMHTSSDEYTRPKKGGLLKKFLDPIRAKKDMIFTNVAMPIRKDR